jgi:hypothetical protein
MTKNIKQWRIVEERVVRERVPLIVNGEAMIDALGNYSRGKIVSEGEAGMIVTMHKNALFICDMTTGKKSDLGTPVVGFKELMDERDRLRSQIRAYADALEHIERLQARMIKQKDEWGFA